MKNIIPLLFLLVSCTSIHPDHREATDEMSEAENLAESMIVDVAILRPQTPVPLGEQVLETQIRSSARRFLIDERQYSVPADSWVDQTVNTLPDVDSPERAVAASGSDAALLFTIDQFETESLMAKGRMYVGGQAVLFDANGAVWQRTFRDWLRLAPTDVNSANRHEVMQHMINSVVSEVLSPIPNKMHK